MRSRLARSELPVSVTSTMASASMGGLTSVAPQENSTRTLDAFPAKVVPRHVHQFGGDDFARQVFSALQLENLPGTASTQRTLPRLCLA